MLHLRMNPKRFERMPLSGLLRRSTRQAHISSVAYSGNGSLFFGLHKIHPTPQVFFVSGAKFLVKCLLISCLFFPKTAFAENWKITAYCACIKCCGKSDAITASGKKASPNHTVALNWLPFGTKVLIGNRQYVVEDRGAESLFGTYYHRKGQKNEIKHIDIFMDSHSTARAFGVRYQEVKVL